MRKTVHINRKQAANFAPAIRLADKLALPLNRFVTFSFAHLPCSEDEVSQRFSNLRAQRFGPLLNRPPRNKGLLPSRPAFLWVIENAGCLNVHWLVHVPDKRQREFEARLAGWVEEIFGPMQHETAVKVQQSYNPKGCSLYMLKGMDPYLAHFYGVEPEDQGCVTGKRCGVSISLGPSETRKHGTRRRWKPYALMQAAANRP